MLMKPFPNVFFIIRKFTTIFERVATVVGDFLGMDWTALFQLVDVRRQIFEALPPTPLLPLLQLLHLFTREAKTASVSLATSLVAGEHLNAKSCARKPGIAVLSEAITAYTSDIIRYQIDLSAFSANSKSQSISTLNIKPRPLPDLLGSFSDKWLRLKPSAISAHQTPLKWTWTMYNWGINTKFFCWSEITWVDTATPGQLPVGTGKDFGKSCSSLVFFRDIRTCSHQKIFQKRCF